MIPVRSRDFGESKRVLYVKDSEGNEKKIPFNSLDDLVNLEITGLQGKVVSARVYRSHGKGMEPYEEFGNVKRDLNIKKSIKAVAEKNTTETKHIEREPEVESGSQPQTSELQQVPEKPLPYYDGAEIKFDSSKGQPVHGYELLERVLRYRLVDGKEVETDLNKVRETAKQLEDKFVAGTQILVIAQGKGQSRAGFYYIFRQK